MRAFQQAETICKKHSGDANQSACESAMIIHDDAWRTLERSGLCYGDDRTYRAIWRWGKCGRHSLHPGAK
jgi:hypothetical protein